MQPFRPNVETPPYKHTFLHVPCKPPVESRKSIALHIRSHTFCATLPLNRESAPLCPSCILFAIWGVCPQMAISDTCRHVPDTFLHVPCPCLQFRNLPPLPASLYPPLHKEGTPSDEGHKNKRVRGIPSETACRLGALLTLGAHARALQSCKGKAPHSLSRMHLAINYHA